MTIDRETVIRLAREARGLLTMDESLITMLPEELARFAALVLEHGRKPLTFEQIEDCFPDGAGTTPDGLIEVSAQWLHDFARAIEREAAVPLLKQIEEDEALMRDTLEALSAHSIFKNDACAVAAEALRQRLEAKK